jgi:hypothetical protein
MTYGTASHTNRGKQYKLKASGAETASTTGHALNTGNESGSLFVTVKVTAATGTTPTMTVVIEGSADGTNWFTLGTVGANGYAAGTTATAPTNFTAAATVRAAFPAMQYVRSRSVIAGTTPSFTYSVTGAVV